MRRIAGILTLGAIKFFLTGQSKMARVSDYFSLNRTQPTLDFVDVDLERDLKVFVDPRALRLLKTDWGEDCVALVQDFFKAVMDAIRQEDHERAQALLRTLTEPNETRLGFSSAKPRGRALGPDSASDVWKALSTSEATKSGLLEDLEDTVLLVEGISSDIISDITTNIIRQPLIHYTAVACEWYGIPLTPDVDSGPMWDPSTGNWFNEHTLLPITPDGKLLLVPKVIVRRQLEYDAGDYYHDFILPHLRDIELNLNSSLVETLRNGKRRVTNKRLREKYGEGKKANLRETKLCPSLLTRYRDSKRDAVRAPLDHSFFADEENTPPPDFKELLKRVLEVAPGKPSATKYERAIESLLTAMFYPALSQPTRQHEIHNGRKRIDITYANVAKHGFFDWVGAHFGAPQIAVECKNYVDDPANPEIDQLSGRFSDRRGWVGILVCRQMMDRHLLLQRCKDTANDGRGYILCLDDDDLKRMVAAIEADPGGHLAFPLLQGRFNELIN